jgi:methylated-DNA-[protein]-cysteine S-methyltransferase
MDMGPKLYKVDCPLGVLFIEADGDMPVRIVLPGGKRAGTSYICSPGDNVRRIAKAVEAYFQGMDPPEPLVKKLVKGMRLSPFAENVLMEVSRIPRGRTASYAEIAARAGKPHAARYVGNLMHANPFPILIPCHRVIKSDGKPGGYGGGEMVKIWLLGFEAASLVLS